MSLPLRDARGWEIVKREMQSSDRSSEQVGQENYARLRGVELVNDSFCHKSLPDTKFSSRARRWLTNEHSQGHPGKSKMGTACRAPTIWQARERGRGRIFLGR